MKVVVTGGTGLVGSALRDLVSLQASGDEWEFLSSKQYDLVSIDDVKRMFNDMKPDVVVHLAANVGGLYKNMRDKVKMYEDNMLMGLQVIKLANEFNVQRLICMCSTCVFPDDILYPITEEQLHNGQPHKSNEGYAYAKRMLEIHCKLMNECFNREYVCVIPTNIFGPHDNFSLRDGHVLPALIHKCHVAQASGSPFVVKGSGSPLRQFVYSKDLAEFILLCIHELDCSKFKDKSYSIICSPDPEDEISIAEAAEHIAQCFKYTHMMEFDTSFADGQYRKTCSNSRLRGMFPEMKFTPFKEGIRTTIDWFVANFDGCRK